MRGAAPQGASIPIFCCLEEFKSTAYSILPFPQRPGHPGMPPASNNQALLPRKKGGCLSIPISQCGLWGAPGLYLLGIGEGWTLLPAMLLQITEGSVSILLSPSMGRQLSATHEFPQIKPLVKKHFVPVVMTPDNFCSVYLSVSVHG